MPGEGDAVAALPPGSAGDPPEVSATLVRRGGTIRADIRLEGPARDRIREALMRAGFLPLRAEAQRLVDAGITDEAEVVRVLGAHAGESITDAERAPVQGGGRG